MDRDEAIATPIAGQTAETEGLAAYGGLSRIASILVLVGVFFAILMGAMDGLVVATVLPTIALDLHQVNGVTFVAGAYLISSTISIPIFARLSDIASRRNVFLVGLGVFIVGSALAGLSQNLSELIVFRAHAGSRRGGRLPGRHRDGRGAVPSQDEGAGDRRPDRRGRDRDRPGPPRGKLHRLRDDLALGLLHQSPVRNHGDGRAPVRSGAAPPRASRAGSTSREPGCCPAGWAP